jgi:TRAP-type C4-dicarboxylate transport system substrate-binding protein
MTDVPLSYLVGLFAVDKSAFQRLDPDDQRIVRETFDNVFERLNRLNREDNQAARQALKANGMEFVVPTDAELVLWKEVAREATDEFREAGRVHEPTLELIRRLIREYREAKQTADGL